MRQEIEELNNGVALLNAENDKLVKQLEINERNYSILKDSEKELRMVVKGRDEECEHLWDTLRDVLEFYIDFLDDESGKD